MSTKRQKRTRRTPPFQRSINFTPAPNDDPVPEYLSVAAKIEAVARLLDPLRTLDIESVLRATIRDVIAARCGNQLNAGVIARLHAMLDLPDTK